MFFSNSGEVQEIVDLVFGKIGRHGKALGSFDITRNFLLLSFLIFTITVGERLDSGGLAADFGGRLTRLSLLLHPNFSHHTPPALRTVCGRLSSPLAFHPALILFILFIFFTTK
jgi:hypothetical protein